MLIDALRRGRARADGAGRPRHAPEPPPAAARPQPRWRSRCSTAAERRIHGDRAIAEAAPGPLLVRAGSDFELSHALVDERPPLNPSGGS